MCIGKNVRLKPTKTSQKLAWPSLSSSIRPVIFGIPVVDPREDREDGPTEQHVVEVGDDEVRVRHLLVERDRREHHAREAADHERDEEAEHVEERRPDHGPALQHRREPCEDLDPARDRDDRARRGEEREGDLRQADREHVVHPDAEAEERSRHRRERDPVIRDESTGARRPARSTRRSPPRAGR